MKKCKSFNFETILNNISAPILVTKNSTDEKDKYIDFDIIYYNDSLLKATGISEEKISKLSEFSRLVDPNINWIGMAEDSYLGKINKDVRYLSNDTQKLYKIETNHISEGKDELIIFTFLNVTSEREYFSKLKQSLITDSLTGFPNRIGFNDVFEPILENARKNQTFVGLVILDIDNLKNVNDSMGSKEGDALIVSVSNILKQFQRGYIRVFRYGDDEFAIVLSECSSIDSIYTFADTLYEAFQIKQIGISAGISIFPEHSEIKDEIIRFADMAVHYAKKNGKNTFEFFEPDMQRIFIQHLTLQSKLTNAILESNFKQFYQPQFDIRTGELRGFEALIRWHDEEIGDIAPSVFIPLAEETGLIVPIGRWVLETAIDSLKKWHDKYNFTGIMSVNVSPIQLKMESFIPELQALLEKYEINPSLLEIEITEGVMINNMQATIDKLTEIRNLGVKVSLDDFGTGYSSLSYLQMLPLNTLKIDKAFINNITASDGIQANITHSIISMVEKMGLETIAEGVEHPEQLELLNKFKCTIVQGFLRGRPMPYSNCDSYLRGDKSALLKN